SFATGAGIYDALFKKAGPAADGTLEPEAVTSNVATMVGPDQAEAMLTQWLYEYVSFALFVAESMLRAGAQGLALPDRGEGRAPPSGEGSGSKASRKKIGELIAPLAPKG